MQVINAKTGKPEELDPIKITEGLASGTHLPPPGQGVLLNPNSELVFVPAEDVQENVYKYGYKVPQPDELRKIGRDFTYGTDSAMLQAGLAGAARGGTFGVSDYLAVKTGLTSPEHLSALKEYYPTTSTLGEIGGAVGTAFIPGSLVGQVVKGAKAAEAFAVGKAAAALPAKAAANVIAKTAIETGGKALGGAIEGMAFGLGQTVSEAALGDPDLNAEKIMANVGYGGLLGGALGAAFYAGSKGLKSAVGKAREASNAFYEKYIGKTEITPVSGAAPEGIPGFEVPKAGEAVEVGPSATEQTTEQFVPGPLMRGAAKVSSFFSGKPEKEILDNLIASKDPTKIVLTTAERDAKVAQMVKNLQQTYKSADELMSYANKIERPAEIKNLLADVDISGPKFQYDTVLGKLKSAVAKIDERPSIYSKTLRGELEVLLEDGRKLSSAGFENPIKVYDELKLIRQKLDDMQMFEKGFVKDRADRNTINEFVRPLASEVRQGLEMGEVWGEAAARQAAFNNKFSKLINSTKAIEQELFVTKKGRGPRPIKRVGARKVNMWFNQINETRGQDANEAFIDFLESLRGFVDEVELTSKNVPGSKLDIGAVKDFTETISKNAMEAQKYVQKAEGGYGFFRDLMDQSKTGSLTGFGVMAKTANAIGTAFTDPDKLVWALSKMEGFGQSVNKRVQQTSKFIFEKVKPPTRGAGIIIQESTTQRTDRYKKAIDKLKTLTDVPDAMLDDLDAATRETFEYAPRISQGLQMAAVRATTFLQSKMPQPPDKGILDTPYEPSQAQIITFMRYHDAVDNPMIALKQLEDNYVPRETLETLKSVYPSLYNDMKESLIGEMSDKMAAGKLTLPYQRRVVLSQFLEMPLDSSFRPEIIARNQEQLAVISQKAEAKEAAQQAVRPTQTGLGKVSLANRSETGLEKVVARA